MFEIMHTVKGYGRIMLKKFIVSGLAGNLNDKKVMTVTAFEALQSFGYDNSSQIWLWP